MAFSGENQYHPPRAGAVVSSNSHPSSTLWLWHLHMDTNGHGKENVEAVLLLIDLLVGDSQTVLLRFLSNSLGKHPVRSCRRRLALPLFGSDTVVCGGVSYSCFEANGLLLLD
jgi:hypothetical protein